MNQRHKIALISILSLFGMILVYLSILYILAPQQYIRKVKKILTENTSISTASGYRHEMVRDKAYVDARLGMVKEDSIHLVVDLTRSQIFLSIEGVDFHKIEIRKGKLDPLLKKASPELYTYLFQRAASITEELSTITKEPIQIKQAPKDTIEAAQNIFTPDTTHREKVMFRFNLDNGSRLLVYGISESDWKTTRRRFHAAERRRYRNELIKGSFHQMNLPYRPTITIYLPSRDAKVFYRAVPTSGRVIIRY